MTMPIGAQDPVKFLTIIREINTLLELKRGRFNQTGPQLVADEPALARPERLHLREHFGSAFLGKVIFALPLTCYPSP